MAQPAAIDLQRERLALATYAAAMRQWVAALSGVPHELALSVQVDRPAYLKPTTSSGAMLVCELFLDTDHDKPTPRSVPLPQTVPEHRRTTPFGQPYQSTKFYANKLLLLINNVRAHLVLFVNRHVYETMIKKFEQRSQMRGNGFGRVFIVCDPHALPALKLRGSSDWVDREMIDGLVSDTQTIRPAQITAYAAKVNVAALAIRSQWLESGIKRAAFLDVGVVGESAEQARFDGLDAVLKGAAGSDGLALASVHENRSTGVWPAGAFFGGSAEAIERFDEHLAALVIRCQAQPEPQCASQKKESSRLC